MLAIQPPPPKKAPNSIFTVLPRLTHLARIFDPTSYGTIATTFRTFGPLYRFDHQRHPIGHPDHDPARGILYCALNLSGCIVERFGDEGIITCNPFQFAKLQLMRDVKLLDLRDNGAMRAGTIAAISKVDHPIAQQWSRYFYEQPEYDHCDGLIYSNRHNDEVSIALYERAEDALNKSKTVSIPLADPSLLDAIAELALTTNLDVVP